MPGVITRAAPGGSRSLADVVPGVARDARTRAAFEERGTHVPPFLIRSVSSACNLRCAGCYARANGAVGAEAAARELTDAQWARVLDEADEIGASFVLLAGGEPLMRRGVIELAARHRDMVFPVFTNGTLLDGDYLDLFDRSRNLVPALSLEGTPRAPTRAGAAGSPPAWDGPSRRWANGESSGALR